MPETPIDETFGTYLNRLETVNPTLIDKPIITSTDVNIPYLKDGEDYSITKTPIAWPLYQYNLFYTVNVPAKKHIPTHTHDEDVFRYVVKGSLLINKVVRIHEGEWFVIRKGTPYEIDTETGYVTIASYKNRCQTRGGVKFAGKHLVVEE